MTKYLGMVEVTQEDIDNGNCTGSKCPVALALKRTFYGSSDGEHKTSEVWVPQPKYSSEFRVLSQNLKMPRSVKRFITKFDSIVGSPPNRDKVKPFKFKAVTI